MQEAERLTASSPDGGFFSRPCGRRRRSFPEGDTTEQEALEAFVRTAEEARASNHTQHKSSMERSLMAARSRVQAVSDSWWMTGSQKQELEAAASLLRSVELEIGKLRKKSGGGKSALEELLEQEKKGRGDDGPEFSKRKSMSKRWLLQTFTEAGEEMAFSSRRGSFKEMSEEKEASSRRSSGSDMLDSEADDGIAQMSDDIPRVLDEYEAQKLLDHAGQLDFDVFKFAQLPGIAGKMLQALFMHSARAGLIQKLGDEGSIAEVKPFSDSLYLFLGKIEDSYHKDVLYHNAIHAADTMMTMEWWLQCKVVAEQVTALDRLMATTACAIHDVGHPGRNNLFHSKTLTPLAIRYNDKSILENMHVATAFEIMQEDRRLDWISKLNHAFVSRGDQATAVNLQQNMRRGLIDIVLGTDMAKHNQHQKHVQSLVEAQKHAEEASRCLEAPLGSKMELLETLMHAADVSNPCKPRPIMLEWTKRVVEEFWAQGDEEKSLDVEVSLMCDRVTGETSVPKQQIGFTNFVILPFFTPLAQLIPEAQAATANLLENRAFWEEQEKNQASFSDLYGC